MKFKLCIPNLVLLFTTIPCWIIGCLGSFYGVLILQKITDVTWLPKEFSYIVHTLILLGSFVILGGFLGCFGIITDSSRLIIVYSIYQMLMWCLHVFVGVIVCLYLKEIAEFSSIAIYTIWQHKTERPALMDNVQKFFKCCGLHGKADYTRYNFAVPKSCCTQKDCSQTYGGCLDYDRMSLLYCGFEYVIYAVLIILLLECFTMIFACWLAKNKQHLIYEMRKSSEI